MAHGLSCSTACGIFPDQGSNPCPLHWQAILNHCVTREAHEEATNEAWATSSQRNSMILSVFSSSV